MRSADTDARGIIEIMNVAMTTDMRICTRYERYATSVPTSIWPLLTKLAPSHSTATLDALMRKFTVGNIDDIRRPARSDTSVRSALASEKRRASCGSRTNARTTRIPVICSRSTRFTWSMRSCINRKAGTMRDTSVPSTTAATGIATTRMIDNSTLWRSARMTPTTIVIGAAMAIVHAITTNICTCCTSLVIRVMSDGAPNLPTSRVEKSVT